MATHPTLTLPRGSRMSSHWLAWIRRYNRRIRRKISTKILTCIRQLLEDQHMITAVSLRSRICGPTRTVRRWSDPVVNNRHELRPQRETGRWFR